MLFWKDNDVLTSCKFCNAPRYKVSGESSNKQKRNLFALSQLRYLPLTPRLQWLYTSKATASHMTWHHTNEKVDGVMSHPSDAEAWKQFDMTYSDFTGEPRNIRFGLCADGFSPHGQYGKTYSCWPVIVSPYNLPPEMCMKSPYMFLSLIYPGPTNPKYIYMCI